MSSMIKKVSLTMFYDHLRPGTVDKSLLIGIALYRPKLMETAELRFYKNHKRWAKTYPNRVLAKILKESGNNAEVRSGGGVEISCERSSRS